MSKLKKLASLLLALALVFTLGVGAFADEETPTTYTITINTETSGYTYVAYQIFAGDLYEETTTTGEGDDAVTTTTKILSNITWGSDINSTNETLVAALQAKYNTTDAAAIAELITTEAEAAAFAEIVAPYVTGGTSITYSTTNKNYSATVSAAGYYLIKNTGVPSGTDITNTSYSDYILEVVSNVEVDPKDGVPTLDKEVDSTTDETDETTADYAVGDDVPFTLTATMPTNYADYTTYKLVFHDTLSSGLSFNNNVTVTVSVPTGTTTDDDGNTVTTYTTYTIPATTTVGEETVTNYTVNYTKDENQSDGCTFEVVITDTNALYDASGSKITVTAGSIITVTYTAKLTTDATTTYQNNDAYLEYFNNPNDSSDTGTTPNDKTYVINMTLTVNKTDGDKNALSGAGFTLYKWDAEATYTYEDEDGSEQTGTGVWVAVGDELTVTAVYDTDGETILSYTVNFTGLGVGDYKLVESTTPDGYNTADDLYFTIDATTEETTTGATATVTVKDSDGNTISTTTASDSATFTVNSTTITTTVVNESGSTLPSTGGIGTTIFYIVGGILVLGAAVLLITRKRMSKAE